MNKFIYLTYINKLKASIDSGNGLIQVLLGPRQVGKTTSILKLAEDFYADQTHYVSADKVFNANSNWIREQWTQSQSDKKILVIDEIQKCHNWAEVIKSLYDEFKKRKQIVRCVLLGSSSLEIQKGLTESLTGRFQLIQAYHWNFSESCEAYGLTFQEFLKFGGYPGSYPFINGSDWVNYVKNSIIATVIEKDILQFQTVKNPSLFRQAFEILMAYPAQEISYTKLLGQLQEKGNVELIKNYISMYEGAFLMRALEKFSVKVIKVKSSSPKILPLAPCLFYLTIRDEYASDELGRVFELAVGAQLVRTGEELFYWREGQHEVDFVLKVGRKVLAIEVKSGRKKGTKGMDVFLSQFPKAQPIYITFDNYSKFEKDPMNFLENYIS
jgi:predicted AAA+ superfamily ATPase